MPSRRCFLLPLALLVLAGCLLAGCGGGSSTQGTSASTAQRRLIAEADPICAAASAARATANAKLGKKPSFGNPATMFAIAQTAPGVAAAESQAVAKLHKLQAPASLSKDWQTLLTGLQQLAAATEKLGNDAKENNPQGAQQLVASTQPTRTKLLAIATRDGFASCGRND